MKKIMLICAVLLGLGCAKVMVQTPKEPIKLDISMRLDIYQHVENDIDAIEDLVSGSGAEVPAGDKQSFLGYIVPNAYAQEELSPEIKQAALRRRDRRAELVSWQAKGVVGENKLGLVAIRDASSADSSVEALVDAENKDRQLIYQAVAVKNGTSVEEVKKMYAKRLINDAPAGAPVEVLASAGGYEWTIK